MELTWVRREFSEKTRGWILIVIASSWFFTLGVRMSLPVLLPHISIEYDLSLASGGLLMTLMFGSYAIGQLPGGILGDQLGERNVLVGSLLLVTSGATLVVLSGSLWGVIGGIVLLSFAGGMFAPVRFTILSDIYPKNEGSAHGIAMSAGDVGNTTLPVIAGFLAGSFAWRLGIGFTIPFLLALVTSLLLIIPQRTSEESNVGIVSKRLIRSVWRELSQRRILLVVCLLMTQSLIYQGHTGLYPTYLVTEKGMSEETASIMLGVFFGSTAITHLIAGISSDRLGAKPVIATLLSIGVLAFGSLPFVYEFKMIAVVTIFTGAPIGVITIALPYLISQLSDEMQGTGFGMIRMMYISSASISPFIVGFLGDVGYFDLGFFFLGGTAAFALLVSYYLPERQ